MELNERGVYTSAEHEPNAVACCKNLRARIRLLTDDPDNKKELSNDWGVVSKYNSEEEGLRCLCGMKIKHVYCIENCENGNKALIGSSCIAKFNNRDLNKQVRDCNREYCEDCEKWVINLPLHLTTSIHERRVNSKECETAGCYKRIDRVPEWKTWCFKCYMKNKKEAYLK